MRDVYIFFGEEFTEVPADEEMPSAEFYVGGPAYQFLLELITGLRSKIVGETEVFGQFKCFLERCEKENHDQWYYFKKWAHFLIVDCKKIREKFLTGIGNQSYGSLVRRHLGAREHVLVLGAGMLTKDILPWVQSSERKVDVLVRNLDRARALQEKYPEVIFREIQGSLCIEKPYCLIIAAPIPNDELMILLQLWGSPQLVMDLRDVTTQVMNIGVPWLSLQELFLVLKEQNSLIQKIVLSVRNEIRKLTEVRLETIVHRPFGWEDVCA